VNKVEVEFISDPIFDIPAEVSSQLELFRPRVTEGMRIAITAGSRGIANIALILKTTISTLKSFGADPFIVPAMGSHAGATAEGQTAMLSEYGITEEAMGAPILSSMKVEAVGVLPGDEGLPLYMDAYAHAADAVFVVNRVKAHTDFHGANESGIAKMLSIGLGKHAQAIATHEYLVDGLRSFIPRIAEAIISGGHILGGLGIVEDGYDQTSIIRAVNAQDLVKVDAELLTLSKAMMPSLPFTDIQLLIVDWLGKNISGTGMDPNIIGRLGINGEDDSLPNINTIALFDLTTESHGNGLGVGLADVIPRSLAEKVDWKATYENVCTSRFLRRGALPVTMDSDRVVIDTALSVCGHATKDTLRMVRIRDTLHIDEIYVSDALLSELAGNTKVKIAERGIPFTFDDCGVMEKLK
jgi:hypothetical protein